MGQIRGIREKGKKRGRKGRRMFGILHVSIFLYFCYNVTGESVRKEQK